MLTSRVFYVVDFLKVTIIVLRQHLRDMTVEYSDGCPILLFLDFLMHYKNLVTLEEFK